MISSKLGSRFAIGIALTILVPIAVEAATVVVPNDLERTEGNRENGLPFNLGLFSVGSARYQQVYAASAFPPSPIRITRIAFRPDAGGGRSFSSELPNVQLNLSTTARSVDDLSLEFAANLGADDAVVFSGALQLSSAFARPGSVPKSFDILIDFLQPFDYYPTSGNLLIDVRNFSGGVTTQFDAVEAIDSMSRVSTADRTNVKSQTAQFSDTAGLVTHFAYTEVPESSAIALGATAALVTSVLRRGARRRSKRSGAERHGTQRG
jgi:hypothetical protein